MLGLFSSASDRSAKQLRTHINALKGLDDQGLAGLALYCSFVRLAELGHIYKHTADETYAKFVALYYRPLVVDLPFAAAAIKKMDQSLLKTERQRTKFAHNPFAQGLFGLMGAAEQTWRNTWLGCAHAEVRYLGREMWGLISIGFPSVEETALTLMHDPQFKATPHEIDLFSGVIRDDGSGPDYSKIPEGFEPLNRQS